MGTWLYLCFANETAKAGSVAYNHQSGKTFSASFDQDDSLGLEIDLDYNYKLSEETID